MPDENWRRNARRPRKPKDLRQKALAASRRMNTQLDGADRQTCHRLWLQAWHAGWAAACRAYEAREDALRTSRTDPSASPAAPDAP